MKFLMNYLEPNFIRLTQEKFEINNLFIWVSNSYKNKDLTTF